MFLQQLRQWLDRSATGSRTRPTPRPRARLMVEPLEVRTVPASFTAATVPELIAGITAANQSPEADTITLAPGKTFTLSEVNNTDHGATGLPVIEAEGGSLTIVGNGDVIQRSTAKGTPAFRLLDVAFGATLTLQNLTLQRGLIYSGWDGEDYLGGGAIFSKGTLTLLGVTVQNNVAQGHEIQPAFGGGIYSSGALRLENCVVRNNQALGGAGAWSSNEWGTFAWNGGPGAGGGVYVDGGTATLLGTTITGNVAKGGGTGGHGTKPGGGFGGGLSIGFNSVAYLDAFTVDHITNNKASTRDPNIVGAYTVLS